MKNIKAIAATITIMAITALTIIMALSMYAAVWGHA